MIIADSKGSDQLQAALDFNHARTKALLSQIQNFMNADRDKLLSFNDVKEILRPRNQVYRGMQVIPINKIIGSEGRYRDFTKYFLPRSEHLRIRWERIDIANLRDIPLPPISIYEIGGAYFVRDGNHRVSVARSQGAEAIDAEVTSLSTEIAINPSMTVDDLREAVISYEKKIFYDNTFFGDLTDDWELDFTQPGRYDVIYNYILVHKYFLNQEMKEELPFGDALVSWYNKVYLPINEIIENDNIYADFPGRKPGDLYVWIVKHWDYLKKENGLDYPAEDAARDFSEKFGKARGGFLSGKISRLIQVFRAGLSGRKRRRKKG